MSEVVAMMAPEDGATIDYDHEEDRVSNWDDISTYREFRRVGEESNILNHFDPITIDGHRYEDELASLDVGETFAPSKN